MSVLDELEHKRDFTTGEATIADYLLANAHEVPEMAINDLAKAVHHSKSSIIRLCRKLGLEGYRELKIEIVRNLEWRRSQIHQVDPNRPFLEESNTSDITSALSTLTKQAVDSTYASISVKTVRRAAQLILGARHVVYYALGDSCAAMAIFVQLLYKIGIVCTSALPMGDRGVLARTLGVHDLAIIVSHSGNVVNTYRSTIDMLRARGCKTILITANPAIAEGLMGTDCVFILPEGETREERLATFYSQACTQYVLNCIYAEAYAANYQHNIDNWQAEMRQAGK